MDPKNQNEQSREKQSGGGFSQGINTINNLAGGRFKNPLGFGKTGFRVITQTGSKIATFLFTSPAGWIAIGITVVVFFTIIVVLGIGGAPPSETDTQSIAIPTIAPTLPAAP